jgi:hypothetical protein
MRAAFCILICLLIFRGFILLYSILTANEIPFGGEHFDAWHYKTAARYLITAGLDLLAMIAALIVICRLDNILSKLIASAAACIFFYGVSFLFVVIFP